MLAYIALVDGMSNNAIFRKIFFYRLICEKDNKDGDLVKIFDYIDKLPFDEHGRYSKLPSGNLLSMFVDSTNKPIKFRIGTIRKRGLPVIEKKGVTNPLILAADEGLLEPVHVMIFDKNVIGFEANFYGPRIGNLPNYLYQKTIDLIDKIEVKPIIRKDILQMLSRVGEIKVFSISFQRDMDKYLKDLDKNLIDAIKGIKKGTDAPYIDIVLKHKPHSRKGIKISFLKDKPRVAKWLSKPEVIEGLDKFKIKCKDIQTQSTIEFDLLQQYFVSKKLIEAKDDKHKVVNKEAAYNAIISSYLELKDEINNLIGEE